MSPNEPGTGAMQELTKDQIDIIGEVSNISMGSAATALSNIIGKKVTITSPKVELGTKESIDGLQRIPSVGVVISYTEGIIGKDILIIRKDDANEIVKVLMGGELPDEEFGELHISAIAEVMNQMMGSAATALAGFIGRSVNISPPNAFMLTDENREEKLKFLYENVHEIVLVRFLFQVENMFQSDIYMIMTHDFATELVSAMMQNMGLEEPPRETQAPQPESAPEPVRQPEIQPEPEAYAASEPRMQRQAPPEPRQQAAAARMAAVPTSVRPAILPSFDEEEILTPDEAANFDLIQGVPLELSVEVGRAKKLVKEVIDFNVGTIIELDKQAGDPVDIIVNGQLIAHGEVVVIDESFGVRITEIINKKSSGR